MSKEVLSEREAFEREFPLPLQIELNLGEGGYYPKARYHGDWTKQLAWDYNTRWEAWQARAAYISKAEPVAFGKTYMGELQDGWLELTREGAEIELDYLNSKYPDTTNQRAILPLYAAPDSSHIAGDKPEQGEIKFRLFLSPAGVLFCHAEGEPGYLTGKEYLVAEFTYRPTPARSNEGMRVVPVDDQLVAEFQELNMGNYTDDDVRRLNNWAIEAYAMLSAADGTGGEDSIAFLQSQLATVNGLLADRDDHSDPIAVEQYRHRKKELQAELDAAIAAQRQEGGGV